MIVPERSAGNKETKQRLEV